MLVTGGAGYIGAHTCKLLAQKGYAPIAFDNLSTGHESFVRWGPLIKGDIRDSASVARALAGSGAEAVIHFAANAEVGESVVNPAKYYDNNVAGTLSLLKGMAEAGVAQIVFSSTCSLYGAVGSKPLSEALAPAPVNPYARSKWMIEQILADYGAATGLRSICLRYFNACGADPEGEIGEWHEPETHLIPRAVLAILGKVPDFAVFGDDYDTPDGTAIRDYVHVTDLAAAHLAALERLRGGHGSGVYNLGSGTGYSVRQVLACIEQVSGKPVPMRMAPRRAGDPPALVADAGLARAELGFAPAHSDLETIIRTAWRWHSAHHQGEG